jgi:hypothetical protein
MGHLGGPAGDVSTVDKLDRVNDFKWLIADVRGFLTFGFLARRQRQRTRIFSTILAKFFLRKLEPGRN